MFEKDAEEYVNTHVAPPFSISEQDLYDCFQRAATFGYNKANEWHYVKDGDLPKVSGRYWVYTGGEPFTLDFDTEVNAFGYWRLDVGDDFGIRDTIFETVADLDEDKVIAWKEIVLPKLPKENAKLPKENV